MEPVSYKEKAEAYVRGKLPKLMELSAGCEVMVNDNIRCINDGSSPLYVENGKIVDVWTGCGCCAGSRTFKKFEIIGHPIQLQHWLTALDLPPNSKIENYTENRFGLYTGKVRIFFNRTTGQPATEEDYQAFCEIVNC